MNEDRVRHVIKYENKVYWCGESVNPFYWSFQDAQHVALSVGGSVVPCRVCLKAIVETLQKEI